MLIQKAFPNLNTDEVHIWSAYLLENRHDIPYFSSILSSDEYERAKKFKFSKDQQQFITTRGILRCLLSKYLGDPPENIEILYGLWGKPCVDKEKNLHFNVSHSGDYALFSLARDVEVGIDIECINRALDLEDMATYLFSATELAIWKNLNPDDKVNSFFKHWVCKEAFLKAKGTGWLEDKSKINFAFQNVTTKKIMPDSYESPYYFDFIPGYASAFCIDEGSLLPRFYSVGQYILRSV